MFPSVMIFVLLLYVIVDVFEYLQGRITKKNSTDEICYCCCQLCMGEVENFWEENYWYRLLLFQAWIFVCVFLEGPLQQ